MYIVILEELYVFMSQIIILPEIFLFSLPCFLTAVKKKKKKEPKGHWSIQLYNFRFLFHHQIKSSTIQLKLLNC